MKGLIKAEWSLEGLSAKTIGEIVTFVMDHGGDIAFNTKPEGDPASRAYSVPAGEPTPKKRAQGAYRVKRAKKAHYRKKTRAEGVTKGCMRWSKEDLFYLKKFHAKKNMTELKKELGRTRTAIYHKLQRLGISPRDIGTERG